MKATAKRRRSRKQIQEDKEREAWEKQETARKIQRLAQLEREREEMKVENEKAQVIHQHVQGYMDAGLIVQGPDGIPQLNADQIIAS